MDIELNFDNEEDYIAFENGMAILEEFHDIYLTPENLEAYEQSGGFGSSNIAEGLNKLFTPERKKSFTRVMRGVIRSSSGAVADVLTIGAGGDTVVNSFFAVQSSTSFLNDINDLLRSLVAAKDLFGNLIKIDTKKKVPITSRLNLDDGFQSFEYNFERIFSYYITTHGTRHLDTIHKYIVNIISKVTTLVSDWVACLFPDTLGIAGEITKTVLDHVALHGFTYIYNLVSVIPDNLQQMITNKYALSAMIKKAIAYLRNLLKNMDPKQIAEIIQAIGIKGSDLIDNKLMKGSVKLGTEAASKVTRVALATFNKTSSVSMFKSQDIIIMLIDKFITPNIDAGVNLFDQMFPLFLMFTLYIEKYPIYTAKRITLVEKK